MQRPSEQILSKKSRVAEITAWTRYFLLHFLELQIPMGLGALVCFILGRLVPATSSFAAIYHPGTYLFAAGDVLFLTVPVVAWMAVRGHGWGHSLGIAAAMIAPVVFILIPGELARAGYLLWLVNGMYPVMCLGMLFYMLYRRDLFTNRLVELDE